MTSDRKMAALFSLFAVAVTAVYYAPFLKNYFAFDDFKYLENMFGGPRAILLGYGNIRVVSNLAWWPLYQIAGLNPLPYNLFSLVLHTANGILLYLFVMRFLKDRTLAFLCGGFFLLCSAGCDALFWKAAGNTLINGFLYLATLYLYVSFRQSGNRTYFLWSIGSYLLAAFSKEDAASLPFVVLLLELVFFEGRKNLPAVMTRLTPYIAIILFYILAGNLFFTHLFHTAVEHHKLFKLRPLYSLLGGWTVFFLPPDGYLEFRNPAIYLTFAAVVAGLFWVKDKKLLLFGYGWIIFAFLPQSLTVLGQFEPRDLPNSISRYLYLPSMGASLVLAAALLSVQQRFSRRLFYGVAAVALIWFSLVHYERVQQRGNQWREEAEPTAQFLQAIRERILQFPPNTFVHVVNAPTGRAFVQQALRAIYGNPEITWIADPAAYVRKPDENGFLIVCEWGDDGKTLVDLQIRQAQ